MLLLKTMACRMSCACRILAIKFPINLSWARPTAIFFPGEAYGVVKRRSKQFISKISKSKAFFS